MTRKQLRDRDYGRLLLVHPVLRSVATQILLAFDILDFPLVITSTARTAAEQVALYRQGRKLENGIWVPIDMVHRTGIVTNADGVTKRSNHQIKADGLGYAVDFAFLIDGPDRDGELTTPSWNEQHPWMLLGEMAEALGRALPIGQKIIWGGRWQSLRDLPHVELVLS